MLTLVLFAMVASGDQPIIVTAERKTQEALAECLARQCSVREDAIASIKHAQAQFAAGDYPDARITLRAALRRNGDAIDKDPRAVSALWYALGRVTLHNGDMDEFRKSAMRAGAILDQSTIVTPHERVLGGTQIADALLMSGDVHGAVRRYRSMAENARERGEKKYAELLEIRALNAQSLLAGRGSTKRAVTRMLNEEQLSNAAQLTALSLAANLQDRKRPPDQILAKIPVQATNAPVQLIWSPRTPLRELVDRDGGNIGLMTGLSPQSSDLGHYSWADIGFWIRPDGRVESVEILRESGRNSWSGGIANLVQSRRYAPFQAEAGDPGHYKIERVSLTREMLTPIGSLIRRRAGKPSFRWEDMKIEQSGTLAGTPPQPL